MIAGFQLMRIIIVLIWCRTALILFERLADWTFGKAAAGRQASERRRHRSVTTKRFALC